MIPIFNVVLISDKDKNAINTGKHFVLFHFRSSRSEVFCKKGVLKNFGKFTAKYQCQSLFLVKLQARGLQLYFIKKETPTVFPCEFCEISKNTSGGCFCNLSKYFDKLYGNIFHKMQIQMSNLIQVPASLLLAAISEFWFSGLSRHTIYKLITAVTAFLIAFLRKINNKNLDQKISILLTLSKYFTRSLTLFCTCERFFNIPKGYLHYNW